MFDSVYNRRFTSSLKWSNVSDEKISMWVADMDFKCPEFILNALTDVINQGFLGYSITENSYYDATIKWFTEQHRYNKLVKENILPVNGIMPGLAAIINTFSNQGDTVIIQTPVYYRVIEILNESKRIALHNPIKLSPDGQYNLDAVQLESLRLRNPKIFILCSPQNPVGKVWSKEELRIIGNFCLENNILLVVDEIHCDLVHTGHNFVSYAALPDIYLENTIILTSPTKTFNIAGLRGGNLFIFNLDIYRMLEKKIILYGINKINTLYATALTAGYNQCKPWLSGVNSYIEKNAVYITNFINHEIPILRCAPLQATYLMWIDYRNIQVDEATFIKSLETKIILSPGSKFGPNGTGYIRINIASPFSIVERCMTELKQIVTNLTKN